MQQSSSRCFFSQGAGGRSPRRSPAQVAGWVAADLARRRQRAEGSGFILVMGVEIPAEPRNV